MHHTYIVPFQGFAMLFLAQSKAMLLTKHKTFAKRFATAIRSKTNIASTSDHVLGEKKNKVYWIRLNRVKQYNAMSLEMYDQLNEHLKVAANDSDVHIALVTNNGKYFSSGNDLSMYPGNI